MHSSIDLSEDTEKRKAIADEPVPPAITAASTPTTLTTPATPTTLDATATTDTTDTTDTSDTPKTKRDTTPLRVVSLSSPLPHPSPQRRRTRHHQAITFRAGKLAGRSDTGLRDRELTGESIAQLRIERLLNLRVVAVNGYRKQAKHAQAGVRDGQDQLSTAG